MRCEKDRGLPCGRLHIFFEWVAIEAFTCELLQLIGKEMWRWEAAAWQRWSSGGNLGTQKERKRRQSSLSGRQQHQGEVCDWEDKAKSAHLEMNRGTHWQLWRLKWKHNKTRWVVKKGKAARGVPKEEKKQWWKQLGTRAPGESTGSRRDSWLVASGVFCRGTESCFVLFI